MWITAILFLGPGRRTVDVQMEIHISAFSVNDVAFDTRIGRGRLLSLGGNCSKNRGRGCDAADRKKSRLVTS